MADRTPAEIAQRWAADGSPEQAIRNIVCHLDTLLTQDQKDAIGWHPAQNVALAVMRVIDAWTTTWEREQQRERLLQDALRALKGLRALILGECGISTYECIDGELADSVIEALEKEPQP